MASKSSYVQVLDEGSLLVFFDDRRYLVNCGEGMQRICAQHGVRLSRLGAVFLTRLAPWRDRIGGLPGMLSTLGDVSAAGVHLAPASAPGDAPGGLQLVGPPHTAHCVGALRAFLRRTSLALSVREYPLLPGGSSGPFLLFDDGTVAVRAVSVGGPVSPIDGCPAQCSELNLAQKRPHAAVGHEASENCDIAVGATRNEFVVRMFKAEDLSQAATQESECNAEECHLRDSVRMPPVAATYCQALCLAIEGPALAGKFDAARARALGVPSGPLCGRLLRGESVNVVVDGVERTVQPEECVGPQTPGATLVVLDLPAHVFWPSPGDVGRRIASLCNGRRVVLAVHLGPADVLLSAEYRAHVLSALPGNAAHVLRPSARIDVPLPVPFPSYGGLARDLHAAGLSVCPSTRASVGPLVAGVLSGSDKATIESFVDKLPGALVATVGRPLERWQWSPHYDALPYSGAVDGQLDGLEVSTWGADDHPVEAYAPSRLSPAVTFLGTGAAVPGKYRNVSATLLDYGDTAVLLDCGEDTHRQLWRRFGGATPTVMSRLRAVLVSHLHADHQLGVISVLAAAPAGTVLVAPARYALFLEEYAECAGHGILDRVRFVSCEDLCDERDLFGTLAPAPAAGDCSASARTHEMRVMAVPVIHCPLAFGFVINKDSPTSTSLVYSGDTRPCPALVHAGHGAAVLVHEATFEHALLDEAVARRHTTADEAVGVARDMAVSALYMTHVSQRYAKAVVPCGAVADVPVVQAAVDLMTVHRGAEDRALHVIGAFSSLFAE